MVALDHTFEDEELIAIIANGGDYRDIITYGRNRILRYLVSPNNALLSELYVNASQIIDDLNCIIQTESVAIKSMILWKVIKDFSNPE